MENCDHKEWIQKPQTRIFQGEEFQYEAETCVTCGSVLWNDTIERQYNEWLSALHKRSDKRHLFQVQYSLTHNAEMCLGKMAEKYAGIDESSLVRAIVFAYLEASERVDMEPLTEMASSSETYSSLVGGEKTWKKVQFKPHGMKSIIAICNLLQVKPNALVEEAICKALFVKIMQDDEIRGAWNDILLRRVEALLKAS